VKPAPFAYHRPRSREEVDRLLAELGAGAKLLAGGQSLIPILNMRLAAPEHLIDLNFLEEEPAEPVLDDGALVFGPVVRMRAAERSPLVGEHLPLLAEVLHHVAHPAIRSRGTVVGSIAHADPAAELPALLALVEGEARVRGASGRRTVRAAELFAGHLETTLEPGEWIEEVRMPVQGDRGGAFEEFARRQGDYALCGVAALETGDGVALSFVGMGPAPQRHVGDVAEAVARLEPEDDIHASAAYRRRLAEQLGARVAQRAREAA
jgi:aerobic carbon-monoxide dehydrogenase medium subunit